MTKNPNQFGDSSENSAELKATEDVASEGLQLAKSGEYGERFQDILHITRDGSMGMIPSPEGLALKALYHQSRGDIGSSREFGAIEEMAQLYSGELFVNISPQVTPVAIESLALLLQRANKPNEQAKIADTLEAAAEKLRESGYTYSK